MPARRGITRHVVLVMVVAVAALLLTGCLRSEMAVEVGGDGSGTTAIEVYFDDASLSEAGLSGANLVDLVETATENMDEVEVTSVSAAGAEGFRVSIPFDDYRQLAEALTSGEYGGVQTRVFQAFAINEGADGNWSMNATVDPAGFRATLSQVPTVLSGSASQVDVATEFVFSMSLPGKVLRSNATSVDGGKARWNLKGDAGAVNLMMENEPSGLTDLQKALLAVGGLVVVGFLLVFLTAAGSRRKWRAGGSKRRRRRRGPVADPNEQWRPKVPAVGTVGGRDQTGLPVLPSAGAGSIGAVAAPVLPAPNGDATAGSLPLLAAATAAAAAPVAPTAGSQPAAAPVVAAPPTDPTQLSAPLAPPPPAPQVASAAPVAEVQVAPEPLAYTVVTVQPVAYDPAAAQDKVVADDAAVVTPAVPPWPHSDVPPAFLDTHPAGPSPGTAPSQPPGPPPFCGEVPVQPDYPDDDQTRHEI